AQRLALRHVRQRHVFGVARLPVGPTRDVAGVGQDTRRPLRAGGVHENQASEVPIGIPCLIDALVHLERLTLYKGQSLLIVDLHSLSPRYRNRRNRTAIANRAYGAASAGILELSAGNGNDGGGLCSVGPLAGSGVEAGLSTLHHVVVQLDTDYTHFTDANAVILRIGVACMRQHQAGLGDTQHVAAIGGVQSQTAMLACTSANRHTESDSAFSGAGDSVPLFHVDPTTNLECGKCFFELSSHHSPPLLSIAPCVEVIDALGKGIFHLCGGIAYRLAGAMLEHLADRVSRLGILRNGLEHAEDDSFGCILDHLITQLGGNGSLAARGLGQAVGADLGVNGLDLCNQLGAGSYQCVNVDLGGSLGVSEFSLLLADFFVFGGDGGGEFGLSVGQSLCRFLLEPLNFGGVFNVYLDGLIAQNYRFSGHMTLLRTVVGRSARLVIADRGSAPRVTDSCLTACATTRHKGQVVHAYVSHFKICINAVTRLNDVGIIPHADFFMRGLGGLYPLGILDHGVNDDPLAVLGECVPHLAHGVLRPVIGVHAFLGMIDGNRNTGDAVQRVLREHLIRMAVNA